MAVINYYNFWDIQTDKRTRVFQSWKVVSDIYSELGIYLVHNFQLDGKEIRI